MRSRIERSGGIRRRVREPFGKAGLVVACCAVLLACTGGAFAAGQLTGPAKKEVAKIAAKQAKKFATAGPAGKAGPTGPAGPAGPAGPQGPAGTAAAWGSVQTNGSGNATFTMQKGFAGPPTTPQPGLFCIPAPVQGVVVALTLEQPGFIQQVAPNQCGGGGNYEVATQNLAGNPENLPFTILVP
ncbi:MAG: hypothetical protein JSS97_15085 [Actinobacteria bacterium]|nr:hypothetical protein [Actinomycetota bacterium]